MATYGSEFVASRRCDETLTHVHSWDSRVSWHVANRFCLEIPNLLSTVHRRVIVLRKLHKRHNACISIGFVKPSLFGLLFFIIWESEENPADILSTIECLASHCCVVCYSGRGILSSWRTNYGEEISAWNHRVHGESYVSSYQGQSKKCGWRIGNKKKIVEQ